MFYTDQKIIRIHKGLQYLEVNTVQKPLDEFIDGFDQREYGDQLNAVDEQVWFCVAS